MKVIAFILKLFQILKAIFGALLVFVIALMYVFFFLLLAVCIPKKELRIKVSEKVARTWYRYVFYLSGSSIRVTGEENINPKKAYLIVANHQSAFDIYAIGFLRRPFVFISKTTYFKIPLIGTGMRTLGYISIDRTNPRKARKSLDEAAKVLVEENRSIVLFPEGTRSEDGVVQPFKMGALRIAEYTPETSIIPIGIYGTRDIQRKNQLLVRRGNVGLSIGKPIKFQKEVFSSLKKKVMFLKKLEKAVVLEQSVARKLVLKK